MTSHWQFQPIFGSFAFVGLLALVSFALLLVHPTFGRLSPRRRKILIGLRCCLVWLLVMVMLRPTLVSVQKRTQTTHLVVLFDASRSMEYRDADGGRSRWEQQLGLLRQAIPRFENLGEHFQVELIAFAGGIQPQPRVDGSMAITSLPQGEETDIGGALQEAVLRHQMNRLAAVILMSDGSQRAVAPRVPPQQAARQLDRRGAPLYTIALGKSRDESQTRQIRIESLQDEYSVFVKNEFALRVGVRIQGYANQPVAVTVDVEDAQGERVALEPQELVATEGNQLVFADFTYRPDEAGQYRLWVRAREPGAPLASVESTAFLQVREGGLRVLLITSNPLHREQKFIRRSLAQSQDIEFDTHYVSVLSPRQVDLESEVDLEQYDVFLIGDLDANAIHPNNWMRIARLVGNGRGLMMYGGYQSFGPGGYAKTALADVLPVRLEWHEYQPYSPSSPPREDRQVEGPLLMLPTENDSSIMHLAEGAANRTAWESLKPLLGANKFDRIKDEAIVLAESSRGDPLLVQGAFEGGRVLALAVDSTHRWFRQGQAQQHRRFWRQAILWLARRDKREANSVFITMPQRRYLRRSRVTFESGLTDASGDLVRDAELHAELARPDGTSSPVVLADVGQGQSGTVVDTTLPGVYRLTVEARENDVVVASQYAEFYVYVEDFELSNPAANPGLLDLLARTTSRVGGRPIATEQLGGLLDSIKSSPPQDEIETESKWQLGATMGDAWTLFLVLVGLLSSEWYLRKRWGLV